MVVVNKKAVMKIVLYFVLFLLLYGFLFHNEQSRQRSRLYEYGDTAATCRVALTSDFMDDTEMFQSLAPVLREYGANLALFVADGAEDGGEVNQITEYVFLSEPAAFANVRMAEGRFLTEADNGTDVYVSSESSGVPRQVGKVDLFPCGAVLTIRPINPDDIPDRLFDRYAHLTLRSLDDEPYLKLALQSGGISVTSDKSTLSESVPHFYVLLAAVFLALIFIIAIQTNIKTSSALRLAHDVVVVLDLRQQACVLRLVLHQPQSPPFVPLFIWIAIGKFLLVLGWQLIPLLSIKKSPKSPDFGGMSP